MDHNFKVGERIRYRTFKEQSEYLLSLGYTNSGSWGDFLRFTHPDGVNVFLFSEGNPFYNKIGTIIDILRVKESKFGDSVFKIRLEEIYSANITLKFQIAPTILNINIME